jgi:glutathione-independent formaldehyde dehydrogenase
MGPYRGGQAEYLRVPWADFNLLELPQGTGHEKDFTLLSDVFPTGYHGTELAGVQPGRTVAIFGAGPVGLMAALSANLRGAAQTFVVDFQPDRLALAEQMGATAVNVAEADATEAIMEATGGFGVDCGVRGRRLPGTRPGRAGTSRPGARRAGPGGPGHRQHRRGRRLRALGRGRRDRGR